MTVAERIALASQVSMTRMLLMGREQTPPTVRNRRRIQPVNATHSLNFSAGVRKLARSRLRDGGRNTFLDTTALVHESYLRFLDAGALRADDRRAFFAYSSKVMRSIIIDAVRERQAERRGGDLARLTLDTLLAANLPAGEEEVLRVHEALIALEQADPRLAAVTEMRYFGGYSEQEIGEALGLTERTVRRDWEKARLLLMVWLKP